MSTAQIGYGTRFYMMATSGASALTKVAEVTSVSLPNEQIAEVEVTHYESPGRTREFIPGLNDAGEITIGINWHPGDATDAMIVTAKADGAVRTMRVVTPPGDDSQMYSFPGFVKGFERTTPIDDRMTATVTIRVAGAVVQLDTSANPTVP
ncbi:phage tail tube protein [Sphingomonas immobilis]|uniref:Phage tail tube protein n=1 Tax=Sphingomonas immobilis TaxID=3063997 RepID=A0ABT8ZU41_9SPHN|nr:phage tail tube protein [Sphingomonas sp. CA1-15]MDO7841079.1 phage tail tube protein [Sphingomonas sp. CA1-15]